MAIQLNEPVVTAVVARLTADLTAARTAINGAVSDGFTLDAPVEILPYVPPPGLLTAFPSIGIGDGPSLFEDDEGFSATGVHELLIVAYEQDSDQLALAWKLRRWAQAIVTVVLDDRRLDGSAWGTGLRAIAPGPTLGDHEDPAHVKTFMSWVGVRIWAKRDEE